MQKVSWRAIQLGWFLAAVFCISFLGGSYYPSLYGFSLISFIGFLYLIKSKLRCPHCLKRVNLERLTKARKKAYHCAHCNKLIEVDK